MKNRESLRRRRSFREPRARFLIVCEGEVTEPLYFKEVRRIERGIIDLEIVPAGVPKSVVERAVQIKRESQRQAKAGRDQNLLYDRVWCVFDVDEHPFVPEAKEQARANTIEVAVSNPCFELWLLLHFQEQTAHIERDKVHHQCREHMPGYQKAPPCDVLMPRRGTAVERAIQLDNWHATCGTAGDNPSTGVYRLIQQIEDACRPPG
jgi:hypothetical protein